MRTYFYLLERGKLLLLILLLIFACAPKGKPQSQTTEVPLIWPQEPTKPRIIFVRTFSSPKDLGISKGFFQRLAEFLTGSADIYMVRPMAVVVNKEGVIYVADPGVKGIHCFDPVRNRYYLIRGEGGKALQSPVGLIIGSEGDVYVTDSLLDQVFVIKPGSKVAITFPLKVKVEHPTGIAFDSTRGQLYIVDTGSHEVKVFERNGMLLKTLGNRGTGNGEFNYPTLIWRDSNGRLFVTDSLNFRIQIFNGDGKFLGKFGKLGDATGDLFRPKGVATDSFSHIYVVDSVFHTVQIFDLSGEFLLNFGSQGRGLGEFWLPTGIFIGENETIYVADSHNRRIQVFRYIGGQP